MADYEAGLPIRSESDGDDEKVVVKVIDGTPGGTNQMSVDADKNAHVETHGNDPAGLDVVLRLSEQGALTPDGVYDAATNTLPGTVAEILHSRAATPDETNQVFRPTGVDSSDGSNAHCADVAIRDESGNAFTEANPLPVTMVGSEGTPVNVFTESVNLAAGASANIDYTVTALKTLKLQQIEASSAGKLLIAVQRETAVASATYATFWKKRNSVANPDISLWIKELLSQVAGAKIRVVVTNKDNQATDVDVTVSGHEI